MSNAEPTPSPEEVEARLAEVAALNRLCESLAQAGRALRPPRQPRPPEAQDAARPATDGDGKAR
jgi:hypothetical protein